MPYVTFSLQKTETLETIKFTDINFLLETRVSS